MPLQDLSSKPPAGCRSTRCIRPEVPDPMRGPMQSKELTPRRRSTKDFHQRPTSGAMRVSWHERSHLQRPRLHADTTTRKGLRSLPYLPYLKPYQPFSPSTAPERPRQRFRRTRKPTHSYSIGLRLSGIPFSVARISALNHVAKFPSSGCQQQAHFHDRRSQ